MLVVLDNASHAEQIRPLVGSAPGCLTLVTSRSTLAGLVAREGAIPIRLEPLDPEQALVLFRRVSGRVGELDSNHAQLMQYCGYLPLTIRIMACQAADREEGIDNLVQELASTPKKLSAFVTTDGDEMVEVRKVFRASYRALASDAARAFRLLGAHPGPDVTADAAAALFDVDVAVAKQLLGVLVDANMLERPHRGRYAFHNLVREYATEVAAEEPSEDLLAAQRRELMFYLRAADTADRMLAPNRRHVPLEPGDAVSSPPTFGTHAAALAWCEVERPNLMAAINLAGSLGFFDIAWKLPVALIYYFMLSNHRVNRLTASRAALAAARALGDTHAEQWCLTCLGGAELALEQTEDAIEHFAAALDICRVIGDVQGQGIHLGNIAHALHQLGQIRQALSAALDSLERLRQVGDRRSEAITLVTLGHIAADLGELVDAGEYFSQAEVISDHTDLPTQGDIQHGTGQVSLMLGDLRGAVARFSAAVDLHRRAGDRRRLANSLAELGGSLVLRDGRTDAARAAFVEAAHLFEELADPRAAALRQELEEL
jgi:tetratricopeptide (TPR) repeat protein